MGVAGAAINALLSPAAMNFQKLLGVCWRYFLRALLDGLSRLRLLTAPTSPPISFQTI